MTSAPTDSHQLTAGDVMSSPAITVPDSASIWDAWSAMFTNGVRHVVIVRGAHCAGVIDDRQLIQAWQQGPNALRSTSISALVTVPASCVLREASLRQVARIMNVERVDAVPVTDPAGRLIGLITAGDVVHAVAQLGVDSEPALQHRAEGDLSR
jgi:CBS domain-containing protein